MPLHELLPLLPKRVSEVLLKYPTDNIEEIRLRADRPMTLTTPDGNRPTGLTLTREELTDTVTRICQGSLHPYEQALRQGYLPLPNGGRAGVCGILSGGSLMQVTSLCLRVPRTVKGVGLSLCRRLIQNEGEGMLLYSPPGVGKTTLLRDLASLLSSPPYLRRVAVIDSRAELYREDAFSRSIADIYLGYRKAEGIELATRTMSPQYLICDELGHEEASAILSVQSCGVPLIASAHAVTLDALQKRPAFDALLRAGVFGLYVGLRREGCGFGFDLTTREGEAL